MSSGVWPFGRVDPGSGLLGTCGRRLGVAGCLLTSAGMNSSALPAPFVRQARDWSFVCIEVFQFDVSRGLRLQFPGYQSNPMLVQSGWRLGGLRSGETGLSPTMGRGSVVYTVVFGFTLLCGGVFVCTVSRLWCGRLFLYWARSGLAVRGGLKVGQLVLALVIWVCS